MVAVCSSCPRAKIGRRSAGAWRERPDNVSAYVTCKPPERPLGRAPLTAEWQMMHYGFTDEELDFIISYNIKYRMGRDEAD